MKAVAPFRYPIFDFSGGIIGNLSDFALGQKPLVVRGDNLLFTPVRGTSTRGGSRELCAARLAAVPHSLSKYLPTAGTRKLFVGNGTNIHLMTGAALTVQALPVVLTGRQLRFIQLNDVLFCAEYLGGHRPAAYIGTAWEQTNLQAPAAATVAAAGGGAVDVGTHYYRVRNRYVNGSSLATATNPTNLVIAGPNLTVNFAGLPAVAPGGRADWLGWTIEGTKANDPLGASGIYYEIATGNAAVYAHAAADTTMWDAVADTWFTPPGNFNGVTAHYDRLLGWEGTFLYASWEVGALEARYAGIFNFNPRYVMRVGGDDGDIIMATTPQSGRLVIFKNRSMHFLEGTDPLTFQIVNVPDSGGVAGPRACCTINGSTVVHYNQDGLWITRRSTPEAFGWQNIGHYLAEVNASRRDRVALYNVGNRFFVMSYSAGDSTINNQAIVYDLNTRVWSHFTEFYVEDAFVQEDVDFSSARLLAACAKDLDTTDYNCLAMLDGLADLRSSTGTGGVGIPIGQEVQRLDMGLPEAIKNLQRIESIIEGVGTDVTVSISSDTGQTFSYQVRARASGKDWCEDVAVHPDDLEWDVGDWAEDENVGGEPTGIPGGMLGKRFKLTASGITTERSGIRGFVLHGSTRPERKKV